MSAARLTRPQIAWRAAQDVPSGSYVNLGIGMPELVAGFEAATERLNGIRES